MDNIVTSLVFVIFDDCLWVQLNKVVHQSQDFSEFLCDNRIVLLLLFGQFVVVTHLVKFTQFLLFLLQKSLLNFSSFQLNIWGLCWNMETDILKLLCFSFNWSFLGDIPFGEFNVIEILIVEVVRFLACFFWNFQMKKFFDFTWLWLGVPLRIDF